jgi:hypothetical protein
MAVGSSSPSYRFVRPTEQFPVALFFGEQSEIVRDHVGIRHRASDHRARAEYLYRLDAQFTTTRPGCLQERIPIHERSIATQECQLRRDEPAKFCEVARVLGNGDRFVTLDQGFDIALLDALPFASGISGWGVERIVTLHSGNEKRASAAGSFHSRAYARRTRRPRVSDTMLAAGTAPC